MQKKYLSVFLPLIIIISLVLPISAFASEDASYKGIDVSVYQGDIDFSQVKADGIDAVYIRAGEGTNIIDTYFEKNYEGAKQQGLRYGFYHYVTARSVSEAQQQADFFSNLIKSKSYDMRPAMDFENLSGLTADEAVAIAEAYLKRLEENTGKTPVVYSDAYDAQSVWKSNLTDYPLWVADYGVSAPYSTGGWNTWSGFQYDDKGSVDGISGHVDMDIFKDEIMVPDKTSDDKNTPSTHSYTVSCGDTLSSIALQYSVTVEQLVVINDISNPDLIYSGQELLIPY